MKTFIIPTALAIFASLSSAAPAKEARQFQVAIHFEGAPPDVAFFDQSFPADSSVHQVDNPLIVSHISSAGGGFCNFKGADGDSFVLVGEQTIDVGPPQQIVTGSCDIL